jgi:subtilisin-like proprotein convertase family protein
MIKSLHPNPRRLGVLMVAVTALLSLPVAAQTPPQRPTPTAQAAAADAPVITDIWAVTLAAGTDAGATAAALGYENLGAVAGLTDVYLFRVPNSATSSAVVAGAQNTFSRNPTILRFDQQVARRRYPRLPSDPYFTNQWHLNNTFAGQTDNDANVIPAWNAGYTGAGTQIAIVDDGLQWTHPDLLPNYISGGSYDYNGPTAAPGDGDFDPSPVWTSDAHGTAAGGVAAARDNTTCGVGSAYRAGVAGIRLISNAEPDAVEAGALSYQNGIGVETSVSNDIYSNSWGPTDNGGVLDGPGSLTFAALANNTANGRGGKGSIYVWAAGNGRNNDDNINADGYANSRHVIAVGAIGPDGVVSYYSEPGSPMLVTAPSSAAGIGITTTDLMGGLGYDGLADVNCTNRFGGTSSATPLVAGVVALMLQANPNLTWRDVQYILLESAAQTDPTDPDWTTNGAGYLINHNYGFGRVDAGAAVTLAATWENVGPERTVALPLRTVNQPIPDGSLIGVTDSFVVSTDNLPIEHVEVVFSAAHSWRGDINVTLTSPDGTDSRLMVTRPDSSSGGYNSWRFSSVRHWGENPNGTWSIRVYDPISPDSGTFGSWQLILYLQAPPDVPTASTPNDEQTITTASPLASVSLTWNSPTPFNNSGYEVRIHPTDAALGTPIAIDARQVNLSLPIGTYYWQVRALGRDVSIGDSDWSTPRSFTIVSTSGIAPTRNLFTTGTPTLSWTRVSWAAGYRVEVSTNMNFSGALVYSFDTPDSSTLQTTITPALTDGIYYWRVAARNATGALAAWSTVESFVIDV